MKVLVTGASGFVGKRLCTFLLERNHNVIAAVRKNTYFVDGVSINDIGNISEDTNWLPILKDVDAVIHLAGIAHVTKRNKKILNQFRMVNVDATKKLISDAVKQKVKKFIFISSIGVNGTYTNGKPFKSSDLANPRSYYAISKLEAERAIQDLCKNSMTDYIILRPPLIYGKDAPGNVNSISLFLKYKLPLPFGGISNKRSFIAIENLLSVINLTLSNSKALNKVILPSDGVDLSTKDFVKLIGYLNKKSPNIIYLHPKILSLIFFLLGQTRISESLLSDLQIDSSYLFDEMDWKPLINPLDFIQKDN